VTGRPPTLNVGRMNRAFAYAAATVHFLLATPLNAQQPPPTVGAVLQGLDKVTARISTFPASTSEEIRFGTLSIRVRACHKTPPTEPPESTAFLEITDIRPGAEPALLFSGWMFASSPALSALEHPVYDVWVVDCMKASNSSADSSGR
jgi:hypothetical protein